MYIFHHAQHQHTVAITNQAEAGHNESHGKQQNQDKHEPYHIDEQFHDWFSLCMGR
jgi:hypothetical protein